MTGKPSPPIFQPKPRTWLAKFADAFSGLLLGVRGQSSFVVHFFFAFVAFFLAFFLRVSLTELAILAVATGMVLSLELINSALEILCKAVTDLEDSRIDQCLKISSASVLIAAFFSIVVGLSIFGPRLLPLFS